jgi:hypothetical protein
MDKLLNLLNNGGMKAASAAGRAIYEEATDIINEAVGLTPVDTGALRASAHVNSPSYSTGGVEVILGFGGASAPYALYVHENLEAHHPVGQAKFLETPVEQHIPGMVNRIADETDRMLKESI